MATQFNSQNKPEAAGGAKGEVVTPQSEFQTLKLLYKQLEGVEVEEKEDIIIIRKDGLEIRTEKWNDEGNYWVWEIYAKGEEGEVSIYVSSLEQSLEAILYTSKDVKVEISNKIRNERVEEDLYICTKAEYAFDEIKSILSKYEEHGMFGLYLYFREEDLEPELSLLDE